MPQFQSREEYERWKRWKGWSGPPPEESVAQPSPLTQPAEPPPEPAPEVTRAKATERAAWAFLLYTGTGQAILALAVIAVGIVAFLFWDAERIKSLQNEAYTRCIEEATATSQKLLELDLTIIRAGGTPAPRPPTGQHCKEILANR